MLKKAGLDVEFFFTEGGGQTLQVITSGSVDVAMSNGLLGTIGAYSKKAPIRVISAQMTGANEIYWYVRAESKIRSLKDATEKNTIAFSSPGSSSNLILLGAAPAGGLQGQADRDRRAARHAHQRHDRPDRHRLGGAAICAA